MVLDTSRHSIYHIFHTIIDGLAFRLHINPTEYLEDVFQRLMSHSANKLEELLPDRWLAAKQAAL